MNDKIHLIDIIHDDAITQLVSPRLEPHLESEIFSGLTSRTALCVEGIAAVKGCSILPGQYGYAEATSRLWPKLAHLTATYPLHGMDPRPRDGIAANMQIQEETDAVLGFLYRNIELTHKPSSHLEAIEWIRNKKDAFIVKEEPSYRIKKYADRVWRREQLWLKNYTKLAIACARSYDRVLVIGGLTHIIGLHVECGWPIHWLTRHDPQCTPDFVYIAGMNFSTFAARVCAM